MKKAGAKLTGKIYEAKRQYPMLRQFEKSMNTIRKELNKNSLKKD